MKKFIKFVFAAVLFLILALIIGGFIFIKTFDLNKYKSYAEKIAYEQTGRKLSLAGNAGLKISLVPTIVLNDVSFTNAPWAETPNMVSAKNIEVSFAILPLLKKEVVINTVNLINPEINLAINADGTPNWNFTKPTANKQPKAENKNDKKAAAVAATPLLAGFVAKSFNIENAKVVYQDMQNGKTENIAINSFSLKSEDMNSNLNIAFNVDNNGQNITGTVNAGSINSLLQKTSQYPVKANVKAYGAAAKADVVLTDIFSNIGFNGNLEAHNPAGNFGAPDVFVNTDFNGNLQKINADIKTLNINGNILTGMVRADLAQNKPFISANLQSDLLNLQTLTAKPQTTAFNFSLVAGAHAAEFVPDTPLDLSALNLLNANATANIKLFVVDNNLSLSNISLKAALNNGVLNISPLTLNAGGGNINGAVSLNANGNLVNASLIGKDVVLQKLWTPLAVTNDKNFGITSGGNTLLKLNLRGQGATVRKLVESLDGQVIAIIGESEIQTGALRYLTGNFVTQLLNTLKLQKIDKHLALTCAVVRGDINNGKVTFPKGIAFNSKQITVVSNGTLNLKNDKLDFSIHPFNGKLADTNVAQALSSLVKVAGTVQNPKITLDNTAVIKNVVGVATAGPAFLGSQLVLDADETPCYTALSGTEYQTMFPAPSGVKATGQNAYQSTDKAISDGVDALTDTAKDVLKMFKKRK